MTYPSNQKFGEETVAVGRFEPDGPTGYCAWGVPDAPVWATRDEAAQDRRDYLKGLE